MTNVLTNLQADSLTADVKATPDILRQIHSGLQGGQFRTLNLGPEGLFFKRGGKITAFIPHDELWKLESGSPTAAPRPRSGDAPVAPRPRS